LYDHPTAVDLVTESYIGQEYAAGMALVSCLAKEALYRVTLRAGQLANSSVVVANAHHHRSDALSSFVALIGIGGGIVLDTYILDPLAGVFVAFLVLKSGIEVSREAIDDLLDTQIPNELLVEIAHICSAVPGVSMTSSRSLRGRKMGPHIMLDVSITVDGNLTASAAHQLGEHARVAILRKFPVIREVRIHVDPDIRAEFEGDRLLEPQMIIEQKVRAILKNHPMLLGVSEVMVTYTRNHTLNLKIDIILHPNLTIREANKVAVVIRNILKEKMDDVENVDIDLELSERSGTDKQMVIFVEKETTQQLYSSLHEEDEEEDLDWGLESETVPFEDPIITRENLKDRTNAEDILRHRLAKLEELEAAERRAATRPRRPSGDTQI